MSILLQGVTTQPAGWGKSITFSSPDVTEAGGYGSVHVASNGAHARQVTGVTWGGVAMVKKAEVGASATWTSHAAGFELVDPPLGVSTIVVTISSPAGDIARGAAAAFRTGVDPTTPSGAVVSYKGNLTNPQELVVSAATGEVVIDCVSADLIETADASVGAGQTEEWDESGGLRDARHWGSSEPGASSVTMSWTGLGLRPGTHMAWSLKPAAEVEPDVTGEGGGTFGALEGGGTGQARIAGEGGGTLGALSGGGTAELEAMPGLLSGGGAFGALEGGGAGQARIAGQSTFTFGALGGGGEAALEALPGAFLGGGAFGALGGGGEGRVKVRASGGGSFGALRVTGYQSARQSYTRSTHMGLWIGIGM